jgi:hypothetical protein
VHTGKHRDRDAGIEVANGPWREPETKVDLATFERLRLQRALHGGIVYLGEAFCAQQFLRDVSGRIARRVVSDTADPTRRYVLEADPDRGRLRRPLVGKRTPTAKETRGTGHREAGQEIAAGLHDMHARPPLSSQGR